MYERKLAILTTICYFWHDFEIMDVNTFPMQSCHFKTFFASVFLFQRLLLPVHNVTLAANPVNGRKSFYKIPAVQLLINTYCHNLIIMKIWTNTDSKYYHKVLCKALPYISIPCSLSCFYSELLSL